MDIDKTKIKNILNGYSSSSEMPVELKGFNWGAFLLTFIWGIRYKAWITLIVIPLIIFQLPYGLNWLLMTIFQIYFGIKGNEWAYKTDYKKSVYDFKMTQIIWAITGFSIQIIIPMIFISVLCYFIFRSPNNPSDFIQNAVCKTSYKKVKKSVLSFDLNFNDEKTAKLFAEKYNNARLEGNKVIFTTNINGQLMDLYSITFTNADTSNCSLVQKNCKIDVELAVPDEILEARNECSFYIDSDRNIYPASETTKINLQKGDNIFRYL